MPAQSHFTPVATKAYVGFARLSSSSNSRVIFTGCKYAPAAERMTIEASALQYMILCLNASSMERDDGGT